MGADSEAAVGLVAALGRLLRRRAGYGGLVLVAGLLALGLYGYVSSTGLAGTADTYYYLYAAQALRHTGRLLMPDGSPYQVWPPLFATILAVTGAPGPVRWLNGLALLGALAAWSATARHLLPAGRAWALPLLLALSSPALVVSKFIWSEALFNLLWAGYFLVLLAWLRRGGWALGLLATALGCLLPLQRIAGLFLLAGVGAGLAWPGAARLVQPGRRVQLAHLVGTASGFVLWQLHRWPHSAPDKLALPASLPAELLAILADYGFVLGRWLVPLPVAGLGALPAAAWVLVLALVLLALWPRPRPSQPAGAVSAGAGWVTLSARMLFMGLLFTLGLLAVSALPGRAWRGSYDAERYLMPLYPPVVLLVLLAWPAGKRWAARFGPALLAAWLLYQAGRVGHNAYQLRRLPPAAPVGWVKP